MKIAVDFGGTFIKISAYEGDNVQPLWLEKIEAHSDVGIIPALERVSDVIRAHGETKLDIMGVATPGIVDPTARRVTLINRKYADAVQVDFQAWCSERFGSKLVMLNDANAALLGEVAYGCAQGFQNAVLLIIGTGVGTAAMMEGRMVRGAHNQAGILGGHFIMNPFGRGCLCGAVGCLEAYAGSREIIYQAETDRGQVVSSVFDTPKVTMQHIAECYRKGDAYAAKIMQTAIGYYAAAAVNLIHAYDPECVVFSGGLANSGDIMDEVRELTCRQAWLPWGQPAFRVAEKPSQSVTLGLLKEMNDHA